MRKLYTLLLYLLAPLVLLRLAWRGLRAPAYRRRWRERFGLIRPAVGERVVWLHAVSVGEVQAAAPLVRALLQRPEVSLLLTTTTPTGSARVAELFGDEVEHLYAPYDLPGAVARFLDRVRPQLAIIMETELWPNLFNGCRKRGIPLVLVNARLSARSTAGYRRVPRLMAKTLVAVTAIAAQTPRDARRFASLGADPETITVTGNLKYEQEIAVGLAEQAVELRRLWGDSRPVWVARNVSRRSPPSAIGAATGSCCAASIGPARPTPVFSSVTAWVSCCCSTWRVMSPLSVAALCTGAATTCWNRHRPAYRWSPVRMSPILRRSANCWSGRAPAGGWTISRGWRRQSVTGCGTPGNVRRPANGAVG
jgi:hypothetical protein